MNASSRLLSLSLLALAPFLSQCTSTPKQTRAPAPVVAAAPAKSKATSGKEVTSVAGNDALDDYDVVQISDPLEGLNRATFWFNDKMYLVIFRPISKGYEFLIPKRGRRGIDNAFANAKFPVRFVNHALQGHFKDAGRETGKFIVDTVAGLGGIFRVSKDIPALADVPDQDTGKTFAKWGMGHGPYIVIPFLGPSSLRDGVGLIGDYALNPVNWGYFWGGDHDWTMIPPYANTLRALPSSLALYDDARKNAIDPYIAIRSAYVQYRDEFVKK